MLQDRRDVSGIDGGDCLKGRAVPASAASLFEGAAVCRTRAGPPAEAGADRTERRYSKPGESAFRLQISYALPFCRRGLQGGDSAVPGRWRRTFCSLSFSIINIKYGFKLNIHPF